MTSAFERGECPTVEMRHRLRIAREFAGYDTGKLAEVIGVSRNTISNAESGRVKVRTIVVNAWAMACGVPKSWIETGNPPTDHPDGNNGLGIIRTHPKAGSQQRTVPEESRKRA